MTIFQRANQWVNRSIQHRLIVWSTFFWLFSISILSLTFLQVGQTQILAEARQRNVQLASVVSRDVNAKISNILSDLRMFSRYLELQSPELDRQAATLFSFRLSSPQRSRAVYYFANDGNLLFYLNEPRETLFALQNAAIISRPPIQPDNEVMTAYQATESAGIYLSDVKFTEIDRIPVLYVGTRLTFPQETARIVVFKVDLSDIWQRIDMSMVGQSGFTYAVSHQGDIIAHPDRAFIGRRIHPEIEPLISGLEGSIDYTEPSKRDVIIAAYSPVGGSTGWGIVVQQREAEVNAAVVTAGVWIISIWITLAVIGTLGILVLARNLTRPIVELTETTQNIARTGYLTKATRAANTSSNSVDPQPDEIGQLSQAFDQMIEQLQTTQGRLATAAADERNRLARELHDAVTQTLFSASLIAEVLPILWERNQAEGRRRLEEVRQLTRGALAEMRTLLLELRPSALIESELGHLLHQLAEAINGRSRVPVAVTVDGTYALPNETKVALYRIAQEAINNIAKHAGASEANVVLLCEPGGVTLKVSDNGRGFEPDKIKSDSLGLGIMRERASDIGASLTIQSRIGIGTEVAVVWTSNAHDNAPSNDQSSEEQ